MCSASSQTSAQPGSGPGRAPYSSPAAGPNSARPARFRMCTRRSAGASPNRPPRAGQLAQAVSRHGRRIFVADDQHRGAGEQSAVQRSIAAVRARSHAGGHRQGKGRLRNAAFAGQHQDTTDRQQGAVASGAAISSSSVGASPPAPASSRATASGNITGSSSTPASARRNADQARARRASANRGTQAGAGVSGGGAR